MKKLYLTIEIILAVMCIGSAIGVWYIEANTQPTIETTDCYDRLNNKIQGVPCEDETYPNTIHDMLIITSIITILLFVGVTLLDLQQFTQ